MSFISPLFLLGLLVVPALLAFAVIVDRRRARFPVSFTNLDLLASVAPGRRRSWRRWVPLGLFLIGLAAASTALARPKMRLTVQDRNATIVLLVDVSGSMAAKDVKPTRLEAAVVAMRTFIDKVPSQFKVGLIAFSGDTQPLVLPTDDHQSVRDAIGYLAPDAGTAVGAGLKTAVEMIQSSLASRGLVHEAAGVVPAAIVLLSDGKQNGQGLTPIQGADVARAAGIKVFPVSLGTAHGVVELGFGGFKKVQPVPPDPVTMSRIAQITGGKDYTAESASAVVSIYQTLGKSLGRTTKHVQVTSWFALAAAVCLLGALGAGRLTEGRLP